MMLNADDDGDDEDADAAPEDSNLSMDTFCQMSVIAFVCARSRLLYQPFLFFSLALFIACEFIAVLFVPFDLIITIISVPAAVKTIYMIEAIHASQTTTNHRVHICAFPLMKVRTPPLIPSACCDCCRANILCGNRGNLRQFPWPIDSRLRANWLQNCWPTYRDHAAHTNTLLDT